jgi:hypothetical protein
VRDPRAVCKGNFAGLCHESSIGEQKEKIKSAARLVQRLFRGTGMDEKDFKKHLQDLAHGHHHPEEHDWGSAAGAARAPAKTKAPKAAPKARRKAK